MKHSNAGWYRSRTYVHFDRPLSLVKATRLASDPQSVARHSFLPFISYEMLEPRYRQAEKQVVDKSRPIAFASHADAHIFAYYASLLTRSLEASISSKGIANSILAYRRFSGGKCNVHFANSVFDEIRRRGKCLAIAIDVEKFFDSLNHQILKQAWCELLGMQMLPDDHYAVFRAITSFAAVDRSALYKEFGLSLRSRSRSRRPICTPAEFRSRVRGNGLIRRNSLPYGIPQGSPISTLLSNLYMLSTDALIQEQVAMCGALYRRYSDDILIICQESDGQFLEAFVVDKLNNIRLNVNPEKTCRSVYSTDIDGSTVCDRPLQYLGFTFDGRRKSIRSKTLARYQQRVRRAVKSAARAAKKNAREGGNKLRIRRRELFERYSHLGSRNFITYAYRSAKIMNDTTPRRQTRRHWKSLFDLIRRTESEDQSE